MRLAALAALLAPVGLAAAGNGRAGFVLVLLVAAVFAALACDLRLRLDRSLSLKDAFNDAAQVARLDALTGVGNRLAWDEALQLQADARLYDAKAARGLPADTEAPHSVIAFPPAADRR